VGVLRRNFCRADFVVTTPRNQSSNSTHWRAAGRTLTIEFFVVATLYDISDRCSPGNLDIRRCAGGRFGAPAHPKAALPVKPVPGTSCRLKLAVCPADTVAEFEPGAAGDTVNAALTEALRLIVCGEFGASSVIAMIAARVPVATGESDTPIVHVAPTA